jgi:hypothetical protein
VFTRIEHEAPSIPIFFCYFAAPRCRRFINDPIQDGCGCSVRRLGFLLLLPPASASYFFFVEHVTAWMTTDLRHLEEL